MPSRKFQLFEKSKQRRWMPRYRKATEGANEQLKELVTWHNTAIAIFATNYIAFVALMFFISSIIISTTDFDILLDSKLPLPVVSGQVNVRGFYFICPWVIAILHANLLAKLESILARGQFLDEELSVLKDKVLAKRFRFSVVGGTHFVLPGGVAIGDVLTHLCVCIFLVSMFVAPMLLLVFFEWRFLGYHSIWITGFQVAALLLFCLVTCSFWRRRDTVRYFLGDGRVSRTAYWLGIIGPWLPFLLACLLAIPVQSASHPWNAPQWAWLPDAMLFSSGDAKGWGTLTTIGHTLFETRRLDLSGTIVAPPEAKTELVTSGSCENLSASQSFRNIDLIGRDLKGINFDHAKILGINFGKDTDLEGANFYRATIVKSSFEHLSLGFSSFEKACLTEVKASFAVFESSNWVDAKIQKSQFDHAKFRFSSLTRVQIAETPLTSAEFQGAVLREAKLQDLSARDIRLRGADLTHAKLKNVDMAQAEMTAAIIRHSELSDVQMNGAQSRWVDFSGSVLASVQFDDAELSNGTFERSVLGNVSFDRSRLTNTLFEGAVPRRSACAAKETGGAAGNACRHEEAPASSKQEPGRWDEAEYLLCHDEMAFCPLLKRALGSLRTGFSALPELEDIISKRIKTGPKCEARDKVLKRGRPACLGQDPRDLIVQIR